MRHQLSVRDSGRGEPVGPAVRGVRDPEGGSLHRAARRDDVGQEGRVQPPPVPLVGEHPGQPRLRRPPADRRARHHHHHRPAGRGHVRVVRRLRAGAVSAGREAPAHEQQDPDGHPDQHARLAHDGEGDPGGAAERQQLGHGGGARLVHPDAQRDDLERGGQEAVGRFEDERIEGGRRHVADEREDEVDLEDGEGVEAQLPAGHDREPAGLTGVQVVHPILDPAHPFRPAPERTGRRRVSCHPGEETAGGMQAPPDDPVDGGDQQNERPHQRRAGDPPAVRRAEPEHQGDRPAGDDERRRQREEEVLDGQGRQGA